MFFRIFLRLISMGVCLFYKTNRYFLQTTSGTNTEEKEKLFFHSDCYFMHSNLSLKPLCLTENLKILAKKNRKNVPKLYHYAIDRIQNHHVYLQIVRFEYFLGSSSVLKRIYFFLRPVCENFDF